MLSVQYTAANDNDESRLYKSYAWDSLVLQTANFIQELMYHVN